MSDEYHFIQRKILTDLLFANRLKYSQLKPDDMEGSQFTFHLKKLTVEKLLAKKNDFYTLTPKGKNIANTFDIDSKHPRKQAKHSVVFCAFREIDGVLETLIHKRKKNPFYDHQGYPTGKVMFGESIIETAERELYEESGLKGKAEIIGIRHFRVYYPTKEELVEDKVMYICRIDEPEGSISSNEEGDFYWTEFDNVLENVKNPLPELREIVQMLKDFDGYITFGEENYYPKQF